MTTTALVPIQPAFTDSERLALAGFLAGYRGLTREAYALDLRQFTSWCRTRSLPLFGVRRADIEGFARELESRGEEGREVADEGGQGGHLGAGGLDTGDCLLLASGQALWPGEEEPGGPAG